MNFKRIEMAGFKSFADRLEIDFDSGITAIVGPNGCGKSNVADSVRWVLGEQSSKTLRGSSMQDVIFKGTASRKSLSYCEVSLVFDNSDHTLNMEYDEIIITRKLYRSGESEYAINRTPCRLKDVVNLLHDSGVGRDGYSIIGQGKVAEIVNSKPENRRAIFEEAAGIAKFKSRKIEAERKLERVHDHLTRLSDIASELERQLGPMRKQAEDARKCLALKDELRVLEVNAYLVQCETANSRRQEVRDKIQAIQEELTLKEQQLQSCNQKYDNSMEQIQKIDADIAKIHEKVVELSVSIEKQAGETKLIQERMHFLTQQIKSKEDELANANSEKTETIRNLEAKEDKLKTNEMRLKELQLQSDKLSNEYLKVVDELTENEDEVDKNQRNLLESMDKLSDIKANLSRLKAELDALKSTSNEKQDRLKVLIEKSDLAKKSKIECDELTSKLSSQVNEMTLNLDVLKKQMLDSNNRKQQIIDDCQDIQTTLASFISRHKLLTEMQTDYEGFAYSVKKLMQDAESNKAVKEKIVGVVANLIKVPEKFQIAIETSLGNAVQNIVTSDENDAKKLVAYLKENRYGRATFLPITSMKPRNLDNESRKLLNSAGVFGVACDLIEFDKNLSNVFQSLLGGTVIVDTLDTAVKLAQNSKFSFRIVSLEGDIVNPQGSITGGSKKAEINNILGREKEIETLKTEIDKKQKRFADLSKESEELTKIINQANEKIQTIEAQLVNSQIELAKNKEASQKASVQFSETEKDVENLRREINEANARAKSIEDEINSVDELENTIKNSKISANECINKRQSQYDLLKSKKEQYNIENTNLKVQIATIESEIESYREDVKNLKEDIASIDERIAILTVDLAKAQSEVDKEKNIKLEDKGASDYFKLQEELDNAKLKLVDLDKVKQDHQVTLKLIEQERVMINGDFTKVQERKIHEEMNLQKIDDDLNSMATRIMEEYELDYNDCQSYKNPEFNLQESMPRIIEIKKEISKLGYVNMAAIEDIKDLSARYEEMTKEMDDDKKAEEDLLQIIKELSTEMTQKFDDAFNKINENFTKTFRELFGGGNARLMLTESEDTLEAGVDIIAEPPGKKVTNLTLLSGGEQALTAIAILFAILKLRPMPFCLLDEIEAALDDANVERFAKYLHRFSQETQFIVITHRKPTMELADSLYGVTMEEKGVSKVVSVKLSEALSVAEPAQA